MGHAGKLSRLDLPVRVGALAAYCISCVTMAAMTIAALAVAVGVAGATPIPTPLDDFLRTWGLPLLVASIAVLLWSVRRSPWPAIALVAAGGALMVAGMGAMGLGAPLDLTSGMGGMDSHQPSAGSAVPALGIALLFWAGAALLVLGYVLTWRSRRFPRKHGAEFLKKPKT